MSSSKTENGKIPVLVLFAPTATGKTALLRTLFAQSGLSYFNGDAEIISADSMQVYRGMDIGTAKPDDALLSDLPHHLINIYSPDEQFSVADFVKQADAACAEIYSRGKIPVIAGGTGFYIRAFLLGLPETPEADENVRAEIQRRMETEGPSKLYAELQLIDPESAAAIHVHDKYRIQRTLEIYATAGKTRSSFRKKSNLREQYFFCTIVLRMEREMLYRRINQRVDNMFDEGLEQEVRRLMENGYTADSPGMKAIGYREWFFCNSEKDYIAKNVRIQIKADSRVYAKKQYIYMHNIPSSIIIPFDGSEEAVSLVSKEIRKFFDSVK
ncbi:MAG: tRNA (adenosine(37)-N6)-dimethylallyltransferase MiaA [Treponema sp.]